MIEKNINKDGIIDQTIRAGMESIDFLTNDILNCLEKNKFNINNKLIAAGGTAKPSLLQFVTNITKNHMHVAKLKDKTDYGVLKIFVNKLGQTSKRKLNE